MTESSEPAPPEDAPSARIDDVLDTPETGAEAAGETGAEEPLGSRATALDAPEANALAARRRPTVLVLAGAVGCGKTSVYAAIYERLGRGPFGGWMFAGSRTIAGFEQRCHWWRTSSGGSEPYMEHTRANDLPWLHIRLRDSESREPARDLLLGDFDGEFFDQLADNRMQPSELPFLRRADHVGLVIDGEHIAKVTARAAERQQTEYLLERLLIPDALAGTDALSLIVTKSDCLARSRDAEGAESCLAELNQRASKLAGRPVPLLRLAVRSQDPQFPLGHGLETLLEMLGLRPALQIAADPEPYEPATALGRFRA
jgi:hypothetical protein